VEGADRNSFHAVHSAAGPAAAAASCDGGVQRHHRSVCRLRSGQNVRRQLRPCRLGRGAIAGSRAPGQWSHSCSTVLPRAVNSWVITLGMTERSLGRAKYRTKAAEVPTMVLQGAWQMGLHQRGWGRRVANVSAARGMPCRW
jgi:hypothetical protein